MLSGTAEYALRAVLYIAQHGGVQRPVRRDEVAEALGVPRNYLSKILHALTQHGVLASTRGPQGGFRLARSAEGLAICRVIEVFDPVEPQRTCILGRPECSDDRPCPAHARWKGISDQVSAFLRKTTIGDLLREAGSLV
ncbi:MAG TPA: Rrf2 family transcriptional regulator [Longimicrobiales bacterium]